MIVIDSFRSGAKLEKLVFEFLNENDEIITPITQADFNNYSISVNFDPNEQQNQQYSIKGQTKISYNKTINTFSFQELELIGTPLSTTTLQFRSDQIKILNKPLNIYEQNYSFLVKINFRNCTTGEQETKINEQKLCSECQPGFFSFFVDNCQECPSGATCKGGSYLETDKGYWRKTNESSIVIQCSNLLENCAGGQYGDKICYEGHIGALCEECDIYGQYWGSSYSKSSKYQCTKCDQIKRNSWKVGLLTIWTLLSMALAIKSDIKVLREKAVIQTLKKNFKRKYIASMSQSQMKGSDLRSIATQNSINMSSTSISSNKENQSGIFIKMFTNYLQIVGSIATFNLTIPSGKYILFQCSLIQYNITNQGIFELPRSVGEPLKETMNSLDCALQDLDISIPIIYLRLIFSLFIPFIYVIAFLLGITLYTFIMKGKKFPWYILSTAVMFLIIYVQPDLVAQIIALMSCRTIGETDYILSNVSFECYTDEHIFYIQVLIAPLLLVWVFILPIILFLLLLKNKNQLDSIKIKMKYGFLYREYKNYAFYWEFIKMTEKIAITLCLNFYSQSIKTKAILVFIIIMVYGILSLFIQPYQESEVNKIDVNSTHVCALTVLLGLFIYDNSYTYFVYISIVFIVAINVWFIVKIMKKIVGGYIPRIETTVANLLEKLSQKFQYFQKFQKFIRAKKNEKSINPEIKMKFQSIFQKYIQMNPHEKKAFILKVLESQLVETHSHLFGQKSQLLNENTKDLHTSSCALNNKQLSESPQSAPIQPTLIAFKDDQDQLNKDLFLTEGKIETESSLIGIEMKKDDLQLQSSTERYKCTLTNIKDFFIQGQESKVDMIEGDQIVVDMETTENKNI